MFKRRVTLILLAVALVLAGLGWWLQQQPQPVAVPAPVKASAAVVKSLKLSFLDVGQGDSILIQTPAGQKTLIDGGPQAEALLKALAKELGWFDKVINLEILTHPHSDHAAGLNGLFGRYEIKQAAGTAVSFNSSIYDFWLNNLKAKQIKMQIVFAPQVFDLGSGVTLMVLNPPASLADQTVPNLNNSSIVLMLAYGRTKALLTGDAETAVETDLLKRGVDVKAQILKVAHHGSSTATSDEFLAAVKPQVAVISVGKNNDFGHPHERTLNRLERAGVKILRTDQLGTIDFTSDGATWQLAN